MPGQLTKLVYASTLALLVALSYGCKEKYEQKKLPPTDTVEVALPVRKDVEVWDSYTARIEGVKSVQIRARVSGYLEKIMFTDGDYVQQGDVPIDSSEFVVSVG